MTKTAITLPLIAALAIAIGCFTFGLGIAGAGHGWITPFWFSIWGFLAFPIGAWAIISLKRPWHPALYSLLLIIAIASDYLFYVMAEEEGWEYFYRVASFGVLWLTIWSLWQFAVLFAFIAAIRKRAT